MRSIEQHLETANELVQELERSIEPVVRELNELQETIKNTERVEELSERVKEMKFKLAWSWVYNVDREIVKQSKVVEKLNSRLPACQEKIDQRLVSSKYMAVLHHSLLDISLQFFLLMALDDLLILFLVVQYFFPHFISLVMFLLTLIVPFQPTILFSFFC